MKVSDLVNINKDIQSATGMLYEGTKVRIKVINGDQVQVSDLAGRLFWVKSKDISM